MWTVVSSEHSDTTLVIAARAGDKAAFAELLDRHRPMLLALCRRTVGYPDFAEDVAQEAVVQALLSLDRLKKPDRFGPWLAGIGLNLCRRFLHERGNGSWSWEALQGGRREFEPTDGRDRPDELAEAADLALRVRRAIASLPVGQRNAIVLHYISGLTQGEIASSLGIQVGAVKARLHKARVALRRQLIDERKEEKMPVKSQTKPVEMRIVDVRRQRSEEAKPPRHVVVLKEAGGTRRVLLWVGPFEGAAIALNLEKVEVPRPLTFTFIADLLRSLGGVLREVRISKLVEDTYYALAVIEGPEGTRTVDARPSDALSLAQVVGAPISAEPAVLGAAAAWEAAEPHPLQDEIFGEGTQGAAEIVAEVTSNWSKRHGR